MLPHVGAGHTDCGFIPLHFSLSKCGSVGAVGWVLTPTHVKAMPPVFVHKDCGGVCGGGVEVRGGGADTFTPLHPTPPLPQLGNEKRRGKNPPQTHPLAHHHPVHDIVREG